MVEKNFFVKASKLEKDVDLVLVWKKESPLKDHQKPDLGVADDEETCIIRKVYNYSGDVLFFQHFLKQLSKIAHLLAKYDNQLRLQFSDQVGIATLQQTQSDERIFAFPRVFTTIYPGEQYNVVKAKGRRDSMYV